MNMIFVPSNLNRVAFQIFANPAKVVEQIGFNFFVDQIFPVLCTENDVGVNAG